MSKTPTTERSSSNRTFHNRNRFQPRTWPDFCNAVASVSVATFASRRLPELRALWERTLLPELPRIDDCRLHSLGRATCQRHRRRRVSSHQRRLTHRGVPNTTAPTDDNTTPSNDQTHAIGKQAASRKSQRQNRGPLMARHSAWQVSTTVEEKSPNDDSNDIADQYNVAKNGNESVFWMPSHLWLTKRMHMATVWNWRVPMIHQGRGVHAVLRLVQQGKTTLYDATWCSQPIILQISKDTIELAVCQLQRLLPSFAISPELQRGEKGIEYGEGIAHEVDCFPAGCLGPVSWIIRRTYLLQSSANADSTTEYYVNLLVHPSFRFALLQCLQHCFNSSVPISNGIQGGLACLQLRGCHALQSIQSALSTLFIDTSSFLPPDLVSSGFATDGMVLTNHCILQSPINTKDAKESVDMSYSIVLMARCPRSITASATVNYGVCGWDVYCHPRLAQQLVPALVVHGGAVAMGCTEHAHVHMEASPPCPTFPRDYPDTPAGRAYWKTTATTNETESTTSTSDEWMRFRQCWEGGVGRIRWQDQPDRSIPSELMDSSRESVVMVRGAFGTPFVDAIQGFCHAPPEPSRPGKPCKKRRRTLDPTRSIQLSHVSKEQRYQHQEYCQQLLAGMTLPAVLLFHITIDGPGTLQSGDAIRLCGRTIGWCTSGTFSPARGKCHGFAIVEGKKLLQVLSGAKEHDQDVIATSTDTGKNSQEPVDSSDRVVVVMQRSPTGEKAIGLRVGVHNPGRPLCSASLSIQL
jgi:hypothetical protein